LEPKKLGFGLMRLPLMDASDGSSIDLKAVNSMVDAFFAEGFTYFDTAYMYHGNKSELALRECLVKRHPRESFTVATKLPTMFLKEAGDQERIFTEQLEKCGVEYFDYYLLHALDANNYQTAKRLGSFEFVSRLKAEGKVRNIGFSFHDSASLLDEILREHPEMEFVQLQINYADWENAGIQSRQCLEAARRHNKPIVVMEPVKGGTLAHLPEKAEAALRAQAPGLSIPSWAIRFAAGLDGVFMVLSGMSNMEQLQDNMSFMRDFKPLSPKEWESLQQAMDALRGMDPIACTACRYCVDGCPQKIPIPEYFALYNAETRMGKTVFSAQKALYANLIKRYGKASDCEACGQCETMCPQHLPIMMNLAKVAKLFEVKA
jgi:predicted aldo/keto reductase-like oxidoreductase